jgi:hypothetical protein
MSILLPTLPVGLGGEPPVIRRTGKAARSLRATSLMRHGGSSYSEEPEEFLAWRSSSSD